MGMGMKIDRLACGLEQYTDWLHPGALIESQWGVITQKAWCDLEAQRLRIAGKNARRVTHPDNRSVAVFGEPLEET